MWLQLVWIAAAGAAGTLARYGLGALVQHVRRDAAFPWGTLVINALGCFLFGVVWTLSAERLVISPQTRTIILVGFMGAFTTFSTFGFETGQFIRDKQWDWAAANIAAQNVIGVVCVFLGFAVGEKI